MSEYKIVTLNPNNLSFPIQYVQEGGGGLLGREPVPEIYTFIAENLSANQDYWLNLSLLDFSFQPLTAFWANAANNQNQGDIVLTVFDPTRTKALALMTFNSVTLKDGYRFKPMVVQKGNQIKIRPGYAIDRLYFWCKPVAESPVFLV